VSGQLLNGLDGLFSDRGKGPDNFDRCHSGFDQLENLLDRNSCAAEPELPAQYIRRLVKMLA
jgi:hypothetical protein